MSSERLTRAAVLTVITLYVGIQCLCLTAPFAFGDDLREMLFVRGVDSWTELFGSDVFCLFRPIKNLMFAAFSGISERNLVPFRLFAVAAGVFSFFAVRTFLWKLFPNGSWALAGAAVWLLAPTLVSSSAWLSCVNIQLMCAFSALALSAHADGRTGLASLWYSLALLSYEQSVALLAVFVAYDLYLCRRRLCLRASRFACLVYGGIAAAYLVLRSTVGSAEAVGGSFSGTSRMDLVLASAYFTCQHFLIWLFPFGKMAVFGSYIRGSVSIAVLVACWAGVLSVAGVALVLCRRGPVFAFGLAFALVAFSPVSNLLGLGNGPYGDYYMGLPSMGLVIAACAASRWAFESGSWRRLSVSVPLAGFALVRLMTIPEAGAWAMCWGDEEKAFRANVRTFPKAFEAHKHLASLLCDTGRMAEAEEVCKTAESLLDPGSGQLSGIRLIRVVCRLRLHAERDDVLTMIDRAAETADSPDALRLCHYYRGYVLEEIDGDLAAAEREYALAFNPSGKWSPDDVRAAGQYARLLATRGNLAEAEHLFVRILQVDPTDDCAQANLAYVRRHLKPSDEPR